LKKTEPEAKLEPETILKKTEPILKETETLSDMDQARAMKEKALAAKIRRENDERRKEEERKARIAAKLAELDRKAKPAAQPPISVMQRPKDPKPVEPIPKKEEKPETDATTEEARPPSHRPKQIRSGRQSRNEVPGGEFLNGAARNEIKGVARRAPTREEGETNDLKARQAMERTEKKPIPEPERQEVVVAVDEEEKSPATAEESDRRPPSRSSQRHRSRKWRPKTPSIAPEDSVAAPSPELVIPERQWRDKKGSVRRKKATPPTPGVQYDRIWENVPAVTSSGSGWSAAAPVVAMGSATTPVKQAAPRAWSSSVNAALLSQQQNRKAASPGVTLAKKALSEAFAARSS